MDEQSIFLEALGKSTSEQRSAWLDEACGADSPLRQRIEALLANHEPSASFLEQPADEMMKSIAPATAAAESAAIGNDHTLSEESGDHIGPYKLLQQIGEGGFGVVYMAEQERPVRRRVALKVIKAGMDTRAVIARFEAERQALAMMEHPNIARVLGAGATATGRPYFVMELVKGIPITEYCDQARLSTRERLDLFNDVCRAVQHAHLKGIIHRDLKPANVMVTLRDDRPHVKVIDFGIAKATDQKLTEKTLFTAFGQMIGTPAYMSPEQAAISEFDVDTRSDVYSLGVLLYELLTGSTPFDAETLRSAGFDEMRRIIREQEPPKPSTKVSTLDEASRLTTSTGRRIGPESLGRDLRGDLDWIVMKALEKDRTRRYESASALARDIQRHLDSEPVHAVAPSVSYKLRKFVERNRQTVIVTAFIALLLIATTVISTWQAVRAMNALAGEAEQRQLAEENEQKAIGAAHSAKLAANQARESEAEARRAQEIAEGVSQYLVDVFQSPDPERDGRAITVAETLDTAVKKLVDLAGQPERQARLRLTLAKTYYGLGLFEKAIPLAEAARDYYLEEQGPEHLDTLTAMHELAVIYVGSKPQFENHTENSRWKQGQKILDDVLTLRRTALGPNHPDTLKTYVIAARAHSGSERLAMMKDAFALSKEALGPAHPDTLKAMLQLGGSYFDLGRLEEARSLWQDLVPLCRDTLGQEHPETLYATGLLALSLRNTGRVDEGLSLLEDVISLYPKVFGEHHSRTIWAIDSLAVHYSKAKRNDQAVAAGKKALALGRQIRGDDHNQTIAQMNTLTDILVAARQMDEALANAKEALAVEQKRHGEGQPGTLGQMNKLAHVYASAGRLTQALALFDEMLDVMHVKLDDNRADLLRIRYELLSRFVKAGKQEQLLDLTPELRKELASWPRPLDASSPPVAAVLLPPDSLWRWLHPVGGIDPASVDEDFHTTFCATDFDDSAWQSGRDREGASGGFAYGENDFEGVDIGATAGQNSSHAAYFRCRFHTHKSHSQLELRCQRDDGVIVYIDGQEVARDNMLPGTEAYELPALYVVTGNDETMTWRIPIPGTLEPGEHVLAISLHNPEDRSSDLRLGGVSLVELAPEL